MKAGVKRKRTLVIAAHPDDEVLGVGGTMALYAREGGHDVYVLILTEGCSSQYRGDAGVRRRKRAEAERANAVLGVKEVMFEDLPDMRLDSVAHVELNGAIERAIAKVGPETVFTQHPDVNKDHVLVYESTMVAARPVPGQRVKRVYTYPSASSTEWSAPFSNRFFIPNTFVDISSTIGLKLKAFRCYRTEMRAYPHPRAIESIRTYAERDGVSVGLKAAEPFILVRSVEG
jgi:LmbE family N-acetylglucosaminyl deacetylase